MPKCILIADDNGMIRRLIRNFLESKPAFEVCGKAVDGLDAVEKAAELRPDLIILDPPNERVGSGTRPEIHYEPRTGDSLRKLCRCAKTFGPRRCRSHRVLQNVTHRRTCLKDRKSSPR